MCNTPDSYTPHKNKLKIFSRSLFFLLFAVCLLTPALADNSTLAGAYENIILQTPNILVNKQSVAVADINGDGVPELLLECANGPGETIEIYSYDHGQVTHCGSIEWPMVTSTWHYLFQLRDGELVWYGTNATLATHLDSAFLYDYYTMELTFYDLNNASQLMTTKHINYAYAQYQDGSIVYRRTLMDGSMVPSDTVVTENAMMLNAVDRLLLTSPEADYGKYKTSSMDAKDAIQYLKTLSPNLGNERPTTVLSTQRVMVNGRLVYPEIYNIDGYNYFKLRDLALLLNRTGSQFSAYYEYTNDSVVVLTGEPYTSNGTELIVGEDRSSTCVNSRQTLLIDWFDIHLKGYNIGGSNFFQLRELSPLLHFNLAYDEANRIIHITSSDQDAYITLYAPDGRTITIPESEVPDYMAIGWFRSVPVTLYGTNGRTVVVGSDEVESYLAIGWYRTANEVPSGSTQQSQTGKEAWRQAYANVVNALYETYGDPTLYKDNLEGELDTYLGLCGGYLVDLGNSSAPELVVAYSFIERSTNSLQSYIDVYTWNGERALLVDQNHVAASGRFWTQYALCRSGSTYYLAKTFEGLPVQDYTTGAITSVEPETSYCRLDGTSMSVVQTTHTYPDNIVVLIGSYSDIFISNLNDLYGQIA